MRASPPCDTASAHHAPRRLQRQHQWAITLVVCLLCYTIWQWQQPQTYRLVGRYTTADVTLVPSSAGFLLHESADVFTLHDWVTGKATWKVHTPPAGNNRNIALSPRGRFFAAMTPSGHDRRVQVWQDGRPVSDLLLTAFPVRRALIRVMDNGQVYIWYNAHRRWSAQVIDHGRVIAQGALDSGGAASFSPDGKAFVINDRMRSRYATVSIVQGKIVLSHRFTMTDNLPLPGYFTINGFDSLFADGYVVTGDGSIYHETGRVAGADGRREEFFVAPGGRYTLRHDTHSSRVFSPITGDAWEFTVPGTNEGGDATEDGQFATAYCTPALPPVVESLLDRLSSVSNGAISTDMNYIALYQRPGKLRAVLRVNQRAWWKGYGEPMEWWWFPSPDGHALVMNMTDVTGRSQCVLFRW